MTIEPTARKRGQNDGSIHRRKDGRWVAVVNVGYKAGKRDRKYLYGKTRTEVRHKLTKALRDVQLGLPLANDKQTVASFVEGWLESSCRHRVRPSTYDGYKGLIDNHIVPNLGRKRLGQLAPQHLTTLYSALLDSGLAPRTVQYAHAVIHRALQDAVRWNLIPRNPATLVDAPKPQPPQLKVLDIEQVAALLNAASDTPLHALYVLAVTTGMRQGELLGLRWSDVDLDGCTLHVQQQITRTSAGFEFTEPKTNRSRRSISLSPMACIALVKHRLEQVQERLQVKHDWREHDLVFTNSYGGPIERQNLVRRSFKPLLEAAGLPAIRFHDLRHTAATLMLAQNTHPKVVQERLGHATIATTMDTYSHVMPSMQQEAADRLDSSLASALSRSHKSTGANGG